MRMLSKLESFADCFKTKSPNDIGHASRYVSGLLTQTLRKNMERMDERLGKDDSLGEDSYQAMQQFASSSPWDEALVYAKICQLANKRLGGSPDTTVVIDESAHAKKGDASVGVSRQHNGRLGKQDNCQVGVHCVLNCGPHSAMLGTRLFLPDSWISDPEKCRLAGVPEARISQGSLTKTQLARELIAEIIANGVQFACISFDSLYGRDSGLRQYIDELGLIYCADVPCNTGVFLSKPAFATRPEKITEHTIKVEEVAQKMAQDKSKPGRQIQLREGENGIVTAQVWACRVWEWRAEAEQPEELWLIVRAMPDGSYKTSLSNAGRKTSLKRLARWQAGRFYVERCFQDAKSQCGMSQYQTRGWRAWHHHMALVSVALLFMMEERLLNPMEMPMLSAADIVEMMEWVLVQRPTEKELLERIRRRHTQRAKNKLGAVARDREKLSGEKPRKLVLKL